MMETEELTLQDRVEQARHVARKHLEDCGCYAHDLICHNDIIQQMLDILTTGEPHADQATV